MGVLVWVKMVEKFIVWKRVKWFEILGVNLKLFIWLISIVFVVVLFVWSCVN